MDWENKLISIGIVFVLIVVVHAAYRIITGNSLDDDAQWYARMKKEERERKRGKP